MAVKEGEEESLSAPVLLPFLLILQQGDRNLPLIPFAWTQDLSRKGRGTDPGGDMHRNQVLGTTLPCYKCPRVI